MAHGVSVHIGLNGVDASHYQGWDGQLTGCEFDAKDMASIAHTEGFKTETLLTGAATAHALLSAIESAAKKLQSGDTFLLTYSGHGGQVPDTNGDEDDRLDETWVLYDRQVVDDELYAQWATFRPGVRIAVFSDSCHSGTVLRAMPAGIGLEVGTGVTVTRAIDPPPPAPPRIKAMPRAVEQNVYASHRALYDKIQAALPPFDKAEVEASAILISGCQDDQTSADGARNGLFTQSLLEVWNKGAYHGGYRTFRTKIAHRMPPWQSPNLFPLGPSMTTFLRQRPFTI